MGDVEGEAGAGGRGRHRPRSASKVVRSGILINILNPKLTIFFFAFLPQFVSTEDPNAFLQMLGLSAVFMLVTFVVFAAYGLFAAAVRSHVVSRPRVMTWMRRIFAGSFVVLGARRGRLPVRSVECVSDTLRATRRGG